MDERERRAHPRTDLARPCKLYDPTRYKYLPGTTWNLSASGAFLEVDRPIAARPGDRLYLGIALKRRQGILPASEMLEARVIRTLQATDNRSVLAVRFINESEAATMAPRRAA